MAVVVPTGSPRFALQLVVDRKSAVHHLLRREAFVERGPGSLAEAIASLTILGALTDDPRELLRVARFEKKPVLAVGDRFWNAREARSDDRRPTRHRLENYEGKAFAASRRNRK